MADSSDNNSPQPSESAENKGSVLNFLSSLRKKGSDQTVEGQQASSISKGLSKDGPLYAHFKEFQWANQQNVWLKASLVIHGALVLLLLGAVFLAYTRPAYLQLGAPTLAESARDYYTINPTVQEISYDHMAYFVISAVEQLNQLDVYDNPYRTLLQGQVNPEILERTRLRYQNNQGRIKKQKVIQNLVIQRVLPPIVNEANNTLAIYLEGYYAIMLEDSYGDPINRVTPYRGKAILQITPTSELNPFPFFLDDLEEVVGEQAVQQWDKDNRTLFK